jgi:hypothetical protein
VLLSFTDFALCRLLSILPAGTKTIGKKLQQWVRQIMLLKPDSGKELKKEVEFVLTSVLKQAEGTTTFSIIE